MGSFFEAPACTICRHANFSPDESFMSAPLTPAPHHHPLRLNEPVQKWLHLKIDDLQKEVEDLRQENAALTESVNDLEVCVGQLLKEVKFLKAQLIAHAGSKAAS